MDLMKHCMQNIFRKRLRSLLTILGIGIGVLSVVIISLIGEVGKSTINAELNSMGISGLYLSGVGSGDEKLFGQAELETVRTSAGVEGATPLITKMLSVEGRGMATKAVVWGIDQHASSIVSMELLHGRLIRESDVSRKSRVCIVDESFARLLYKRPNIVGKTLTLQLEDGRAEFTVVGVVASGGNLLQGMMGDVVPSFLYVPFTALSAVEGSTEFSEIVAKLEPAADEEQTGQALIAALTSRLAGSGQVELKNLNQHKDRLNSVLDIVTALLSLIGGISLLVAGLSIMTVMLVTVHERTREIGIKKSIGASRRSILAEFLMEAFLLSLIGSLAGASVGLLLGAIGCLLLSLPLSINLASIGFCIVFAVTIGMLFGVYPAQKAASLKPVDALRVE